MANLPITSRVLKSCHKGMKVRDPLLKVGTVTKLTANDPRKINLNNKGGEAEFQKELKKQTDLVSGGNVINYQGGGTFKNQAEKDWYDGQIKQRMDSGMNREEAIQDYRNTFKIGKKKVEKLPDKLVETEKEVDVLTKITPKTQENVGMSNFDARQQGRKSLQINRKLKRQKIKDARADAKAMFPDDKKAQREYIKKQKLQAKKDQATANRQNFQNIADNIKTQTEQGSFGTNKYITDEFLTDNQKNFSAQLKQNEDGSLRTETPQEIYERNNPKTKDFKSVFENMAKDFAKKDFSINVSKNKPQTFFGSGDDKVTFKDIISGIGNNLVGDKSIFAKKDGGTDVGNTLRAINPFNKNDKPKTQTTSQVLDAVDFDGPPVQKKRKPLKKNFFNK